MQLKRLNIEHGANGQLASALRHSGDLDGALKLYRRILKKIPAQLGPGCSLGTPAATYMNSCPHLHEALFLRILSVLMCPSLCVCNHAHRTRPGLDCAANVAQVTQHHDQGVDYPAVADAKVVYHPRDFSRGTQ